MEKQIPERKILPLCKEPVVRELANTATISAICANEFMVNETILEYSLSEENASHAQGDFINCKSDRDETGQISVTADTAVKYACYQEAFQKSSSEILVKVNFFLHSNRRNCLSFFFQKDGKPITDEWKFFCDPRLNSWQEGDALLYEYPVYIKLKEEKTEISCFVSLDEKEWKPAGNMKYVEENVGENMELAVKAEIYENQWLNWLYSNFVQVETDPVKECIHAQYQYTLLKCWGYYYINPFLNFINEDIRVIKEYGVDIKDYLISYLSCEYYPIVCLDEFYLEGRMRAGKWHFQHENLIYGYDRKQKVFQAMGLDADGHPKFTEVSFEQFDQAFESPYNSKEITNLTFAKYELPQTEYPFQMGQLVTMIHEYLEGKDSYERFNPWLMKKKTAAAGIYMYDFILQNQELFLSDIRISYLIAERFYLMRERIEFLIKRSYIEKNDNIAQVLKELEQMNETAKGMVKGVVYYILAKKDSVIGMLKEGIVSLKQQEPQTLKMLEEELKKSREYRGNQK